MVSAKGLRDDAFGRRIGHEFGQPVKALFRPAFHRLSLAS
jgi:hypothetical protein